MFKSLLRTGSISEFTPLGHEGHTVLSVAFQFRETIRARLGKKYANFLAIPKRSEHGDMINWYVPFAYAEGQTEHNIIPWTSAIPEEKDLALEKLYDFELKILSLVEAMEAKDNLVSTDQYLFFNLLYKQEPNIQDKRDNLMAIRYPGPEYIYIVDGQPVITFWGFIKKNITINGRLFTPLEYSKLNNTKMPIIDDIQQEVVDTIVPDKRKLSWWKRIFLFLLPLLLLLGLLLFFLRGCYPTTEIPAGSIPVQEDKQTKVDEPITDKDKELIKQKLPDKTSLLPNVSNNVDLRKHNTSVVRKVKTATKNIDNNSVSSKVIDKNSATSEAIDNNTLSSDSANKSSSTEELVGNTELANNQSVDSEVLAANEQTTTKELMEESESESETEIPSKLDNTEEVATQTETPNTTNDTEVTESSQESPPETNLQLPEDLTKDTDFLNGSWKGVGIQDANSGEAVTLNYDFKDGKGHVKIVRPGAAGSEGSICESDSTATVANGKLGINGVQNVKCSDNTNYSLPDISCDKNPNGKTMCYAIDKDGKRFFIKMNKAK